jgi:hypothetical protein
MKSIEALFQPSVSARALEDGALALGRLAGWWIAETAFARLPSDFPRECTLRPGEFAVLLERTVPSAVIAEGLALPLRWVEGSSHDARLPAGLRTLADRVVSGGDGIAPRRLVLALGDDCPDLSKLRLGAESAGAMLAATFQIAGLGADLDPWVTASAEWSHDGQLRPVQGLVPKQRAAARIGIRTIFVAPAQDPTTDPASPPELRTLAGRSSREQLAELVVALDARPSPESLDAALRWYHRNRRIESRERLARNFFCTELAHRLAARLPLPLPPDPGRRMVVISTRQSEGAAFAVATLRPRQVLVIQSAGKQGLEYAHATAESIRLAVGDVTLAFAELPAVGADGFARLRDASVDFLRGFAPDGASTCIDLTGGTTVMKLALAEAAQRLGMQRMLVDGSETAQVRGGHDVTTLRVVAIP